MVHRRRVRGVGRLQCRLQNAGAIDDAAQTAGQYRQQGPYAGEEENRCDGQLDDVGDTGNR
jgi:hypothetical protein